MDSFLANKQRLSDGSWVKFDETGPEDDGTKSRLDRVDQEDVRINLPAPPRKGDFPPPDVTLATSGHSTLLFSPASQTAENLRDVDRVQRILDLNSVSDPIRLSPEINGDVGETENGKILTTLRATNERCQWIAPPVYHPEMVPQKVVNVLQISLEDYVMCLDVLVSNFRFKLYAVLYKRIIGIWLLITLIVLLALLFSGLRGLGLFVAGLLWLIFAGLGMCLCLYGKKKINDGLSLLVSQANKFMNKQRLMVGVEDRGKLSLHKVVVVVVHYDVLPCLAVTAQMLQELRLVKHDNAVNVYRPSPDLESQDTTPMDKAEQLMLRCMQPYVKDLVRKRLVFSRTKVEDLGLDEVPAVAVEGGPTNPRHCRTSWCLCQYVERMYLRRKPRKWYEKVWNEAW